jgi:hypothetical protein
MALMGMATGLHCRPSSCSARCWPASPCTGDCEAKGSETEDRKAQNINRSIIATASNSPPSPLERPGLRRRRIVNVGSTRRWFRRTSRTKIPTDAAPAFIILTEYLSIGWHGTISVVPNMKIFAITMAGHAEP